MREGIAISSVGFWDKDRKRLLKFVMDSTIESGGKVAMVNAISRELLCVSPPPLPLLMKGILRYEYGPCRLTEDVVGRTIEAFEKKCRIVREEYERRVLTKSRAVERLKALERWYDGEVAPVLKKCVWTGFAASGLKERERAREALEFSEGKALEGKAREGADEDGDWDIDVEGYSDVEFGGPGKEWTDQEKDLIRALQRKIGSPTNMVSRVAAAFHKRASGAGAKCGSMGMIRSAARKLQIADEKEHRPWRELAARGGQ